DGAVAAARTCYSSSGIITPDQVSGAGADTESERDGARTRRDQLARSIFDAGHHTTLQHAHVQFAMDNVSRLFLWSFLHSHPFYNSEQVSQRYTKVDPSNVLIPALEGKPKRIYEKTVAMQMAGYESLSKKLIAPTEEQFFARFPGRRAKADRYRLGIRRKAREVARYVLPLATFAYLYHTVSVVTLLRYWRLCNQEDTPSETQIVVGAMVEELLKIDPDFSTLIDDPLPIESTPEFSFFQERPELYGGGVTAAFIAEFDGQFGENRHSVLVGSKPENEQLVASAVREVLGLPKASMNDEEAIAIALSNPLHSDALNLSTLNKLTRSLFHASYTFRKRLSHAADAQDQRHRMTPASRPVLSAHLLGDPDYITPALVLLDTSARREFDDIMHRTWKAIADLKKEGVPNEWALYLLPNAATVRFTESADLLNLHHKHAMRLCYLAQEEIFQASVEEAQAVGRIDPNLGRYLLPPCGHRHGSTRTPYCPEGDRYCGVPVWNLDLDDYERVI
ncbi:MAG: FAD-dependent thymidylate synthase, partial [Candidatus Latescibacteria bacterium]|nr:FAD-dependent thymidylate synthase [Candidatus Latescibacterota bacterium]